MMKLETIDYEEKINDPEFISDCMAGRESEVTLHVTKGSAILFSVKTKKTNRQHYVSVTIRNESNFIGLKTHIESVYGGNILPIFKKMSLKQNLEGAGKEYQEYLNGLLSHRTVRSDSVLFAFCFVQEKQSIGQSKYERFLQKALDFSRKHLSRILTKPNEQQHNQKDESLQIYRSEALIKRKQFEGVKFKVDSIHEECKCFYKLGVSIGEADLLPPNPYALSLELVSKCQRITTTFLEIEGAYHRRILLLQKIKELKAENIRHKYNSHNQSNEKMLQIERAKHTSWSNILVQQMECTLIILDSLIKQILSKYLSLQRQKYQTSE